MTAKNKNLEFQRMASLFKNKWTVFALPVKSGPLTRVNQTGLRFQGIKCAVLHKMCGSKNFWCSSREQSVHAHLFRKNYF